MQPTDLSVVLSSDGFGSLDTSPVGSDGLNASSAVGVAWSRTSVTEYVRLSPSFDTVHHWVVAYAVWREPPARTSCPASGTGTTSTLSSAPAWIV